MTMHDDAFDELASAYLDNEVAADERAAVETDPALVRRVEGFAEVRNLMNFDSASAVVDESMISAALAAFDDEQDDVAGAATETVAATTATTSTTATNVRSIDAVRRRRTATTMRWLGAAAAATVLVVGAFALRRGADDTAESGSEVSSAPEARLDTGALVESGAADAPTATEAAAESAAPAAAVPASGAVAEEGSPEITAIEGPAVASDAPPAATEAPADTAAAESTVGTDANGAAIVDTVAQLGELGRQVVAAGTIDVPDSVLPTCPELTVEPVRPIVWQGTPAFLMLRPSVTTATEALAVTNACEILATAQL
jgi:hypothetical protein